MSDDAKLWDEDLLAARSAYEDAEQRLQVPLRGIYAEPEDAATNLLNVAEEFGSNHAVLRFLENAEGFGPLHPQAIESQVADLSDSVEDGLEGILVAQERLDRLTATRQTQARSSGGTPMPVVNIGGREFVIDARTKELRSVDDPQERYHLGDDVLRVDGLEASTPAKSLTQRLGQEANVPEAQPRLSPDRSRQR